MLWLALMVSRDFITGLSAGSVPRNVTRSLSSHVPIGVSKVPLTTVPSAL
jgi:hypothetical protein